MSTAVPHVVVVGAGFGGLTAARALADAAGDRPLKVTLVDRRNHHTFQPLLYQVATAALPPQDVGHPVRRIFGPHRGRARGRGPVAVRVAEVVAVDRGAHEVHLADGSRLAYDRLVVAAGAVTSDFGLPGVERHGFGLKSLPEALALRDHVLRQFEQAGHDGDPDDAGRLTFVIAGGGPTGVELAGAMAELVDDVIARDHPDLDIGRVRVVLLEMADRVLGGFHKGSGEYAVRALRERGVEVRLGAALARAAADHVELDDGTTIPTRTLVWVAGVTASPLGGALDARRTRDGRVEVTDTLQLPDDPDVYVIGDLAGARDLDGDLLPQLAPVAIQQGRWVARHLAASLTDGPVPAPFRYRNKGTMATIGRHDAVAELPYGIRFGGVPAWLAWLGLHLFFLVGFRNRVAVFLSWVWNYIANDRSSRLILHAEPSDGADSPALDRAG